MNKVLEFNDQVNHFVFGLIYMIRFSYSISFLGILRRLRVNVCVEKIIFCSFFPINYESVFIIRLINNSEKKLNLITVRLLKSGQCYALQTVCVIVEITVIR